MFILQKSQMSEIWAQLIYIKLTIFIQLDFYHTLFHCFSIHVCVVVPQLSLAVSSRFCFLSFFLSFSILVSLYSFVCVCVWGRDSSPNPASGRTHLCFLMTLPRSHYLRYWLRISLRWATQLKPRLLLLCVFFLCFCIYRFLPSVSWGENPGFHGSHV